MRSTLLVSLVFLCLCSAAVIDRSIDTEWWKHATFYQIYPRSFKDSNNDGIGDLQGIISKLEHVKDAGVTAAWLSPIYKSPMADAGYDISDFRDINPDFGTMKDFEEMVKKANELGIKIVMDLVPNHSSDEHEWFEKSANREPGYENFYVWLDGRENNTKPPNNWISVFRGPAWHYNEKRRQWYLHQFASKQPDLNFRDPAVVKEMKDIITFWLDKGVAGFRVDTIPSLFERGDYPDEPLSNNGQSPDEYGYLQHPYTNDQPETYDMVYQWRKLLDDYSKEKGDYTRIMMTESYSEIKKAMLYYGNETADGAHFTFNFLFITELGRDSSAQDMAMTIQRWMTYMRVGHTANWVLGNHDQHRVATRYGWERVDSLNMLHMILPGVKVVYNGEEIGMENGEVTYEEGDDPQGCNAGKEGYPSASRDFQRTPYHWDDSVNAGFNEGAKTWLPVSEKYKHTNLAAQSQPGVQSHYHVFQQMMKLRNHRTLQHGDLRVQPLNPRVLTIKRELENSETYVLAMNNGNRKETVDLSVLRRLPATLRVQVASVPSGDRVGTNIQTNQLTLNPYEALVLVADSA